MISKIESIMDSPFYILETDSIHNTILKIKNYSGIMVVNSNYQPVGIITPDILLSYFDVLPSLTSVHEIMSKNFKVLDPKDSISDISVENQGIWPVVENNCLVGTVFKEKIYEFYKKKFITFHNIVTHSINGVIIINEEGVIKDLNPVARKLFQWDRQEVIGRKFWELIDPKMSETINRKVYNDETIKVSLNSQTSFFIAKLPIITEEKDSALILVDISKEEFLTSNLEHSKEYSRELESILNSCSEGIFIADGNGIGLKVNEAYEQITGIFAEELIGKNMREVVSKNIVSHSVTLEVLEKKEIVTITQKIKGKKEMLVTGHPIFKENGQISRVVTTVRDMTELNRLLKEITEINQRSEKYYSEILQLRRQLNSDDLTFVSKQMMNVLEISCHLAQFDTTCLILGESGVGKDVIARLLHTNSLRSKMPFIKINCGAIPQNLIEAELFGYDAGAFTGARKEGKPGMFELAHTGTLFLDEIGELPLDLQVKLLQVLQDKTVFRVGGTKSIVVDIRIIAATNRNVLEMVKVGKFREDLYYRLNIVPIEIPPLRERKEDILPLAETFLKQVNLKYGKSKLLSPDLFQYFLDYDWPGNVRELKNMIERLFVVSKGDTISVEEFPKDIIRDNKVCIPHLNTNKLQEATAQVEIYLLAEAQKKFDNLNQIAQELGVDKSTISRKLKKYKLMEGADVQHCKSATQS